ncbi:MAG: M16 family metallopeptidase [Candidatus Baltobacteraceae bacterium]
MEIATAKSLKYAALVLLAGALFLSPVDAAAAPIAQAHSRATTTLRTLPNGLRVLVVEDHLAPVVETAMYYGFGAYDETPGRTGLAHGLEHMMFRGTPSLSGDGLTDAMTQLGATINASTFPDYTRFYFILPSEKLGLALHIEADRMQNLSLKQSDWDIERGAVLTEIIGNAGSTGGRLRQAMLQAVYGKDSRYALDVGGNVPDVRVASAEDLRTYYSQWYAPNNATLVVTGDVQPAAVLAMAAKYFAAIPRKVLPQHIRATPHLNLGGTVTIHGDFTFGFVNIAYPFVGDVGDLQTDAASLLPSIINNTRSPFYKALVEGGYTLGVSASPDTTLHNGLLFVSMTPKPPHTAAEVVEVFEKTMAQFIKDGPAPELVAAAKEEVATQNTFARDSIPGLGYVDGYVVGYEMHDAADKDEQAIARVQRPDVIAAAAEFLKRPAVIGEIIADGAHQAAEATPPPQRINDTFGDRKGSGEIVQADWVKRGISGSLVASNRTHPIQFTLPNGIKVFVQRVPINSTVYVSGAIKSSVTFDPAGKEGTAALLTTLMSYGSKKYDFATRTALQDKLSASITIGQGFRAYGLAKDFPTLVDIVADGVLHPALPQQYFDILKSTFLTAISRRDHSPDYRAGRDLNQILVPPSDPTLREATTESVSSITREDLQAYHDAYLRPDLASITVVGDVSVPQVRAVLTKAFGTWAAVGPKPDTTLPPLKVRPGKIQTVPASGATVSVTLAQPAPPRSSPDFYPLMVLNTILGSGGEMTTRLMQELRVKRGLVYGVSSDYGAYADRGLFEFRLSATPQNVKEAVALLKTQIVNAQNAPPTDAELERAKKYIIGDTLVSEDSVSGIASAISNIGANNLPLDYYQIRNRIFNSVTAEDVLRVAKQYLKPDNFAEVYEGPQF